LDKSDKVQGFRLKAFNPERVQLMEQKEFVIYQLSMLIFHLAADSKPLPYPQMAIDNWQMINDKLFC
jgi:hypothetical protein